MTLKSSGQSVVKWCTRGVSVSGAVPEGPLAVTSRDSSNSQSGVGHTRAGCLPWSLPFSGPPLSGSHSRHRKVHLASACWMSPARRRAPDPGLGKGCSFIHWAPFRPKNLTNCFKPRFPSAEGEPWLRILRREDCSPGLLACPPSSSVGSGDSGSPVHLCVPLSSVLWRN